MDELKTQAILGELEGQRNWALTRCATLAAEIASLKQLVENMENTIEKQKKELKELKPEEEQRNGA